jgi:TolB protein
MRRVLVVAGVVIALVVVTALSRPGGYDRLPRAAPSGPTSVPPTIAPSTTVPPAPTTTAPGPPAPGPSAPGTTAANPPVTSRGRLAVIRPDGSLVTVAPDGSDPVTIAPATGDGTNDEPTWSPDATRLAWSAGAGGGAVHLAGAGGGDRVRQPVAPAPFALAWDPAQARLSYLRTLTGGSVELGILDATGALPPVPLRVESTITATWSPDGSRVLTQLGRDELALIDPSGTAVALGVRAGAARGGAWIDDDRVVVAIRTGGDQRLSVLDVTTGRRRDLFTYEGRVEFALDRSGARLAYQVVPDEDAGGTGGLVALPLPQLPDPPAAEPGRLTVVTLADGASTPVADTPAIAFQWSPDGSQLAYLSGAADGARWRFWQRSAVVDGPAFVPSPASVERHLPRFASNATTITWWSPDSRSFAFAGAVEGRGGIWVVTATSGAPVWVAEGEVVVWSPR